MLIKCPECNREISDQATSCPHCGYPISKKNLEPVKEVPSLKSFTVAYRGGPGSIIAATVFIGIFALSFFVTSLFFIIVGPSFLNTIGYILLVVGIILIIATVVYVSYFIHNARNMSHNCIEYDADKDKLVLCTLYGEIIEINVEDYIELKDNFFTDNMLLFTYRTPSGQSRKVKLGYCCNRDEIRNNINRIKNGKL